MGTSCLIYCLHGEEDRLRLIAERRGWTIASVLTESPATAPDRRVGLAAVRRAVGTSGCQAVVVPSLSMFGSLDATVFLVAQMAEAKATLLSEAERIDASTAEGAAWMAAVTSLRGLQRALRQQKARAGQIRAREAGVRFGRPPIPEKTMVKVRTALAQDGAGIRHVARKTGVSPARVLIEKRAMEAVGSGR
jgi:DNA invertase Pin-like site-specific DNA recombinase